MNKRILTGIFLTAIFASCNLSKKTVETTAESEYTCDENISFATTIKPIFDARCIGCHSGSKPAYGIDLTTYTGASGIYDGRLSCVINWEDNCNKMPPSGGQLSSVERLQIQCWIDNGKNP